MSNHHGNVEGANSRILELDGVRGLAAMAVLICHLPLGFWPGETGVDLFFVLSGFLITRIIVTNADRSGFLTTFYWRRSLRIFPIYYLALFVAFGLNAVRRNPGETDGFHYYLLYLQNVPEYWGAATPPTEISLGHTWTLAIEEQFYLFWPILLLFCGRRGLPWLSLALIVLPIILRANGLSRVVLLGHTDGLGWGGLLAWLSLPRSSSVSKSSKSIVYVAIAVGGLLAYFLMWQFVWEPSGSTGKKFLSSNWPIAVISLAYFGVIGFICTFAGHGLLSPLRWRALVFVGQISYGLYLYHWIIYELLDTILKFGMRFGDPWWLNVLKVVVSFGAAIFSWFLIELPLMRFKDRFSYRGSPSPRSEAMESAVAGE